MNSSTTTISSIAEELTQVFGEQDFTVQQTIDNIPTFWVPASKIVEIARHFKNHPHNPYRMLHDITAIDERMRKHREGQPDSDFTVVYHLFSLESHSYVRLKVPAAVRVLDTVPASKGRRYPPDVRSRARP